MVGDGDQRYMNVALEEARKAFDLEEVPVGAVVVCQGEIVGRGRNSKETSGDPTAHAEVNALREAANKLGQWRLSDCTLYVTLEPCPMCVGAMLSARIKRLVFGCADPKSGAAVSLYSLAQDQRLNHRIEVDSGILETESSDLLKEFFKQRRALRC